MFPEEYKILERLKAIIPEAYFYWALAIGKKPQANSQEPEMRVYSIKRGGHFNG
jgi:hypothetical protein